MTESHAQPQRMMQVRAVTLRTPNGPLRGKVAIDTGPMTLAGLVPTAFELTDVLVARANKKEEKAGRTISCCAGCGACCRHMVPLSPPEAFMMMDLIDSYGDDERARLLDMFTRVDSELSRLNLIDELMNPDYGAHEGPILEIAQKYFLLGIPCPFLVEESCSIHPYRPVGCRDYNVTTPAEWCADPYNNDVAKVSMPIPLSASLARVTAELTGISPRLIPLTLAPRWVRANEELRQKTWPGPDLFDRLMAVFNHWPDRNK